VFCCICCLITLGFDYYMNNSINFVQNFSMKYFILFLLIFFFTIAVDAQQFQSIHQMESNYYNTLDKMDQKGFDILNQFRNTNFDTKLTELNKKVFGYHPYWGGSNYLNYQWNLLSDLCYFSYEVDPYTGNASDLHDWETSSAIDSALANGVKVHLCLTLFSGHSAFFSDQDAQETLISNSIELIENRGAHGVNLDVEALPTSNSADFTNFVINFYNQLKMALPEAELSMASPAVNWGEKLDIPTLRDYLDFFVVMGYDYYWSGSDFAGPVSPLYSMTGSYNYNFSKTISYYQSKDVPNQKIIMAVPYYAYEWQTEDQYAPSETIENASAKTYRYIRDNEDGNYSGENKNMEPNSFGPYYSYQSGNWYQCFVDDAYSMGEKYDIIDRRGLGGVGIWALGYDNGYEELWNLIDEKFSSTPDIPDADTIYDSGGPAFDYYNNEEYLYTVTVAENENLHLLFISLNLEENYDTLWVFDGPDDMSPVIDFYSGDSIPSLLVSTGNTMTLKFYSDGSTAEEGWMAVYDTDTLTPGKPEIIFHGNPFEVYPNPFSNSLTIRFELSQPSHVKLWITEIFSVQYLLISEGEYSQGFHSIAIREMFDNLNKGIWILSGEINGAPFKSVKLLKIN